MAQVEFSKAFVKLKSVNLWRFIMKYLLLVAYLFSATSFASHCNAGASHDEEHEHDSKASHSEMNDESNANESDNSDENVAENEDGSET